MINEEKRLEIEQHQRRDPGKISSGESLTAQIITGDGLPEALCDLVFKRCQFEQVSFTGRGLKNTDFDQCVFKR